MCKLITVITLSYNSGDALYKAIDSVLKQDYLCVEYIILDDCGSDFNKNAVTKYIENNKSTTLKAFSVLQNKRNLGTIKSLNKAIGLSQGEYIFNLSADDVFCDKNVLTDWTRAFDETGAEMITARRVVIDENGDVMFIQPTETQIKQIQEYSPQELFNVLAPVNFIYGSNTARTRASYDKYGALDENYRLIEDYVCALQLLKQGAAVDAINRNAIFYRLDGVSSPSHLTREYLKENDLIFYNEALPYVQDKKAAVKAYKTWKKEAFHRGNIEKLNEKLKAIPPDKKTKRLGTKFFYFLRHDPLYAIKKVLTNGRDKN